MSHLLLLLVILFSLETAGLTILFLTAWLCGRHHSRLLLWSFVECRYSSCVGNWMTFMVDCPNYAIDTHIYQAWSWEGDAGYFQYR